VKPQDDVLSLPPQSVSPDPTKTAATNEHRSERSEQIRRSEQSDRAHVRARNPYSNCAARAPGIPCSISRA
jgi:hypothetical protein